MRSSADFRMELPSVGVVLVGTDTMADRGDSWTGDQREAGTSRWPPVGTWVWPPVDTFSWPGTLRDSLELRPFLSSLWDKCGTRKRWLAPISWSSVRSSRRRESL